MRRIGQSELCPAAAEHFAEYLAEILGNHLELLAELLLHQYRKLRNNLPQLFLRRKNILSLRRQKFKPLLYFLILLNRTDIHIPQCADFPFPFLHGKLLLLLWQSCRIFLRHPQRHFVFLPHLGGNALLFFFQLFLFRQNAQLLILQLVCRFLPFCRRFLGFCGFFRSLLLLCRRFIQSALQGLRLLLQLRRPLLQGFLLLQPQTRIFFIQCRLLLCFFLLCPEGILFLLQAQQLFLHAVYILPDGRKCNFLLRNLLHQHVLFFLAARQAVLKGSQLCICRFHCRFRGSRPFAQCRNFLLGIFRLLRQLLFLQLQKGKLFGSLLLLRQCFFLFAAVTALRHHDPLQFHFFLNRFLLNLLQILICKRKPVAHLRNGSVCRLQSLLQAADFSAPAENMQCLFLL